MKKPIFVAYGDIHHEIWGQFNEGDRRIKESLRVEKEIYKAAAQMKVPKLFLGDLLHREKHIGNRLLAYILPHYAKLWSSSSTPTYAITGNHDQSEQNTLDHQSPSYIRTFSKVFPGLKCVDFNSLQVGSTMIHGVPYLTHDMGLYEHLTTIELDSRNRNILMLHTTLPGSVDTDGREMENLTIGKKTLAKIKKFDLVLVGHIHKPMILGKKKNIIQVGATNQQRKTDKDCELGYWIIYSDMTGKFVPIKSAKFVELEYGQEKPDNKHYYYNKEKVTKKSRDIIKESDNFSQTTDRTLLAESYISEKGIKDKKKKEALTKALKNVE